MFDSARFHVFLNENSRITFQKNTENGTKIREPSRKLRGWQGGIAFQHSCLLLITFA